MRAGPMALARGFCKRGNHPSNQNTSANETKFRWRKCFRFPRLEEVAVIDARYSYEAFARLGPNTLAADELAAKLSGEVAATLRAAVDSEIRRVIEQLRGLGHDLQEWEQRDLSIHSHGYEFGPGESAPLEGWLAIYFDTYAHAIFARVDPEPVGVAGAEQRRTSARRQGAILGCIEEILPTGRLEHALLDSVQSPQITDGR
jgi:hypothetical protein